MRTDTLLRRVGNWWLVRGRHADGFLKLDALNYTEAQALAERERLLPTITDAEVRVMWEMLEELPAPAEVLERYLTPERVGESLVAALEDGHTYEARGVAERMVAAWQRDRAALDALRERLAMVTAQRDALAEPARRWCEQSDDGSDTQLVLRMKADAALATIRAEREATRD